MATLTAALAVRISPEADRLRRELQAALKEPANKIVERALQALKAEVQRHDISSSSPGGGHERA
jgi:hypothetical protein